MISSPKLAYAYRIQRPDFLAPLWGSLTRAIGKNWRVGVTGPAAVKPLITAWQKMLLQPDQLQWLEESAYSPDQLHNIDLVLNANFSETEKSHSEAWFIQHHQGHVMTVAQEPGFDEYDLISKFTEEQLGRSGVTAIVGNGKGKTTSALGIAASEFLNGASVAVVQWFKEKKAGDLTWAINEHYYPDRLQDPSLFQFFPTGAGFVGSPTMDRVSEATEHQQKAEAGVDLATQLITSGKYGVVILDELVDTLPEVMPVLPYALLSTEKVTRLLALANASGTKVILTGRQVTPSWQKFIGDVITVTEVKHPWSFKQAGAISGLDF